MNKKTVIIIFLIVVSVVSVSIIYKMLINEKDESLVNWLFDYDTGITKAKVEKKMVLIDFYADWCSWCTELDQETYSNKEVASYLNEKFICIKIDADKNADLSKNYNVTALPTIIFLSSNGDEVERILGYEPPNQFLTNVKTIVSKYG